MKYYITHDLTKEERKEYKEKGLYCYELRLDDDCNDIVQIERYVLVNNGGSIVTNEEIKLGDNFLDRYVDYKDFICDNESVDSIEELTVLRELFKYYSNDEIIKILKSKERLVYVDDGMNEIVIKYKDIPDFVVDINTRIGCYNLKMYDYYNLKDLEPLISTYGSFLDKCKPEVRDDHIDRLIRLQTGEEKVKDYKVMDEYKIEEAKEQMKKDKVKNKKERNDR